MSTTTSTMGLTKPDTSDKVADTIAALAENFALIDALFPVGSIYQSTKNVNPSTFIGGTWSALEGRVLIGAGTAYAAGVTGGSATHTLTTAELPAHSHDTNALPDTDTGSTWCVSSHEASSATSGTLLTGDTGSGTAFSIMPPYKSVYMWERTA
jgi:hypothetical protein